MAERASASLGVGQPTSGSHEEASSEIWNSSPTLDSWLGTIMQFLAGKLVAVEGIDQAGKRTVCRWLVNELRGRGVPSEIIGFPDYTTALGEVIAQFLQSKHSYPLEVRQHLYAANRWERAAEIRTWLGAGRAVIVDRYSASNIAYGIAQGLDPKWVQRIESGLPTADITLLLDIPPEVSLERKPYQRDAYEARLDLLAGARAAYLDLARDPSWHKIDAVADRDTVRDRVLAALQRHLRDEG